MGSSSPPRSARRPDYQRIARELRQQIIDGKFVPGSRLPSTDELAITWGSSASTIHTALVTLAKEGWIERIHGAGTFVAESKNRFTCAGIYYEADISSSRESNFVRNIHDCLLEQLAALKKETRIFIDSRPIHNRETILPPLADAIQNRHIQCVIAPTATFEKSPSLTKLTVPTAYAIYSGSLNRVAFDMEDFLREGMRYLAREGCRSVGLIGHFPYLLQKEGEILSSLAAYDESLRQVVREEGLATHPDWISKWPEPHVDLENQGYREFQRLWKSSQRPDGLLVYPDTMARGVITAILKFGVEVVPSQMKFVFHRNAHMNLLCPFPVTWGISDEDLLAKRLIQVIEKQFRGDKIAPTLLPYEMKFDDASQWQ